MKNNYVSVIIPVHNDLERLKVCLEAIENQTYPHESYEVFVVDNNSHDSIKQEDLEEFENVNLQFEGRQGSYAARNKGISVSHGDVIAFTDSDCIPSSDWLEKGVECLNSVYNPGLIGGRMEIVFEHPLNPTPAELYEKIFAFPQEDYIKKKKFSVTGNLFTTRSIINKVGMFNDILQSGGDHEWGNRVYSNGYKLYYSGDIIVKHPARRSFSEIYRKHRRITDSYHKVQLIDNEVNIEFVLKLLLDSIPPVITVAKIFLNVNINSTLNKIKVSLIYIIIRYLWVWERFKLLSRKCVQYFRNKLEL